MDVKPGYKQTEVGTIPEDWESVTLGSLGTFSKGRGIRKDDAESGEIPCVRYGELYTHHNDIVRSFYSRISEKVAKTSKKLKKGDILFAGSGETKEEIGKCAAYVCNEEAYAGGDIIILSPTKGDSRFFGYLFNAPIITQQKASKGQGDAIVHISSSALSEIKVPLPTTESEQEAISEALSNADALIESLEQLIAKNRQIKKGAMQELLTGKKRLPGFGDRWETRAIEQLEKDNLIKLYRGKVISQRDIDLVPGDFPIYSSSVNNDGLFGCYGQFMFDEEMITWSVDGGGHFFYRPKHKFSVTNVCGYMRVDTSKINYRFLAAQLQLLHSRKNFDYQIKAHPSVIRKAYELPLPKLAEQKAIATILGDMDNEINTLEEKLTKARQIKKGMMQELLTGRIRLI